MALIGQAVSEKKIFENGGRRTDGRTDDGRTLDHGHLISSPCEPNGTGELKMSLEILTCSPHWLGAYSTPDPDVPNCIVD